MTIRPLSQDLATAGARTTPAPGSLGARQQDFGQAIARESRRVLPGKEQRARETAEQFVAQALVQPVLKQLRESSDVPPPFGPAKGEGQFRSMLDAQIARNMVRHGNWAIVDRVADNLMGRSTPAPAPPPAMPTDAGVTPSFGNLSEASR